MTLESGTRFGPYEITGTIGAGGMGEVYRARDTKLGREVAIKTLPGALATDKERLARFEREAQLLAALNHAHIASVYGLDEHEGTVYLAMELVEGETLEEKLKAGALPVDDALLLALQIAEALEAAHAKGVVHRDLKPANVMVTTDGQAKVLDFGLAKAFSGNPSEASPAHSPALSVAMTQAGLVLGTAGYMSPEQASGQATDQRADVWAFGVVLYEMLTGQPLFSGESVPHVLADVLKTEPDWNRLPQNLHPRLRLLLERCLTKKPRGRLHSIADARIELEAVLTDPTGATAVHTAGAAAPGQSMMPRLIGAVAATAIVAAVAGWLLRPVPAPEPGPVARFSVPLPDGQTLTASAASMIAVSPDGTRIAYVADRQIYLRNLDESEARPIQGTESQSNVGTVAIPAFSPDGQWLVYLDALGANGPFTIKRVPVSGGAPVLLQEVDNFLGFQHGLSWPEPDSILFATDSGVVRMPANGGAVEVLVPRADDERFFSPQLLPGGDAVLFTRVSGDIGTTGGYDAGQIVVQSIGGADGTVVWDGGSAARYLPSGHLVYAQGTALFAIPFDPVARAVRGGPVPLLDNLRRAEGGFTDAANFAVSDTGTFMLIPGTPGAINTTARVQTTLAWVDREGREEGIPVRPDDYTFARISPDGSKVALVVGAGLGRNLPPTIWIYDFDTENLSLLTTDPEVHDGPVWSADSSRIYFRAVTDDTLSIQVIELDTGEVTLIAEASADGFPFPLPWSLSPDSETLAIINAQSQTDVDFATLSLADGEFTRGLSGEGNQSEPTISPNGEWLAHQNVSLDGTAEINIRPFPDITRTRTPVGPGTAPVFSRDGSELFFFDGSGIAAAEIEYEPRLRVGTPRRIIEPGAYMWAHFGRTWDPDPSGERFLLIREPGSTGGAPGNEGEQLRIDVVLNWFEELGTRVPTE